MPRVELFEAVSADAPRLEGMLVPYLDELRRLHGCYAGQTEERGYRYLESYWTEGGRDAFLFRTDQGLAGCALVRGPESTRTGGYQLAEFYVKPAWRRQGVGGRMAAAIWQRFPGRWQLEVHARNSSALAFWTRTVSAAACAPPRSTKVEAEDGERLRLSFRVGTGR